MHALCHTDAHIRCGALRISESNRNEYERKQNADGLKNDATPKSRKDYLENRVRYLLQVTHGVVFYIQIEA